MIIDDLNLPEDAKRWLTDLWDMIQMFDDIEDGDQITEGNKVLWSVLVDMPCNPFWIANQSFLTPVLVTQMLKWQAANAAEKQGKADEKSYMWRAGYWDVVLMVMYICQGKDVNAYGALSLYGETYEEYKEEMGNA